MDFVGFSETKKENIDSKLLDRIAGNKNFVWHQLPARGTAGGVLVGINGDLFEIVGFVNQEFCVTATVRNKTDKSIWQFVAIYGTAYNERKMDFIANLHEVMEKASYPIILGGDFNLTRSDSDKSNGNVNHSTSFLFNDWINKGGLMEISVANRKYTWCNNQEDPIYSTIDRVFVSPSWDAMFPLSILRALPRIGSDHTPIVLDTMARRVTSPNCPDLKNGGWSNLTLKILSKQCGVPQF